MVGSLFTVLEAWLGGTLLVLLILLAVYLVGEHRVDRVLARVFDEQDRPVAPVIDLRRYRGTR